MVTISAYLTRQVNGGGGKEEFTRDFLNRLKNAVLSGDFDRFVETMHVIITPDGQLNFETTAQGGRTEYIYNPYTTERYVEGWYTYDGVRAYYKGSSWVKEGSEGLASCLAVGADRKHIDSWGNMEITAVGRPDYHGRPTSHLLWYTETYTETTPWNTSTMYLTTTLCTIPIFTRTESAQLYLSYVADFCDSKSDNDFNNIKNIMESDLYDYDYEVG